MAAVGKRGVKPKLPDPQELDGVFDASWQELLMQLLLRRILTLIEAGVPATAAATAAALATAKAVIDTTQTAVATTIPATITTLQAGVTLLLAKWITTTKVYPTMAVGVDVTTSATLWTLGAAGTVAATNAITSAYYVLGFHLEANALTAAEYGEVVLYTAAGVEFARARIYAGQLGYVRISPYLCAANATITAKAACSTNNARVITISVQYI